MTEPLDLPKLDLPNGLNVKTMIRNAEASGWAGEVKVDESFISDLKIAKAKHPKKRYVLKMDGDMTDTAVLNAEYVQQAIKSLGALTIHKPADRKALYKFENGGTTTIWVLPIKVLNTTTVTEEGQITVY